MSAGERERGGHCTRMSEMKPREWPIFMPNYIRALGDDKYFRPRLNYRPPSVLFFVKFSTCVLFFFGGQAVLKGAWVSG